MSAIKFGNQRFPIPQESAILEISKGQLDNAQNIMSFAISARTVVMKIMCFKALISNTYVTEKITILRSINT